MEVMGHNSLTWFNEPARCRRYEQWVPSHFNYLRATTIYGGSNEIQKNIIAKLILRPAGRVRSSSMDFDLTDDQQHARRHASTTSSRRTRRRAPPQAARRSDRAGRKRRLGADGRARLARPAVPGDRRAASARGFVDAALVLEQLGTTLVPEPYIPSVLLGGMALCTAGDAGAAGALARAADRGQDARSRSPTPRSDSRYDVARRRRRAPRRTDGGYVLTRREAAGCSTATAPTRSSSRRAPSGEPATRAASRSSSSIATRQASTITPVKTMDGHRAAHVELAASRSPADALPRRRGRRARRCSKSCSTCGAAARVRRRRRHRPRPCSR